MTVIPERKSPDSKSTADVDVTRDGDGVTRDSVEDEDIIQDDNVGSKLNNTDASESGQDIVITGISCRLPRCNSMSEFRDNLLSGVDMTDSTDNNEYGHEFWNGVRHTDKFDASYFGVSDKEADCMDPQLRMLLEVATEAVFDAGIEASSLRARRVGVYIGVGEDHAGEAWCTNPDNLNECATTGPSYCIQGSDAASCVALDRAYQDMLTGDIDTALVGGSSLSFKQSSILKYQQQGLMSKDFISRPFDAHADGIVGGDGVVAMLLQYKSDAKRIYAEIIHSKSIISPTQESGLSYASTESQADLLREVYTESGIDPSYVEYVELHATGLPDSDTEELEAVSSVLCSNRTSPLLIGSVNSYTGHTLATSGLVSIAKSLVAFEEGMIPANRNVTHVNPSIPELYEGKMEIVTENIRPMVRLFGVNNLGFGGYHTHCILDGNVKPRMLHYMASMMTRLCVYSGRTEDGVKKALKFLYDNQEDIELQALSNETACMSPLKMPYRGYCLMNSQEKVFHIQRCSSRMVNRPVWFVFSGMGTQWPGMGRKMMALDTFKTSILESSEVLHQYGINLYKLIMEGADNSFERPLNSFIVITAIQIALVKLLKDMGIVPDGMIGHSSGEIACGYTNGCLTAREAILAAYWEGFCIQELDPLPGAMAAVGLTWCEAKRQCPDGVVPACHNAENTVTVSGPTEKVNGFVQQLKDLGIFTREVKSAGVAFHSPAINDVVPLLREYLSKLIEAKPKTQAWISTSVPEDLWDTERNATCSVDYLINNLTSPVLFQEALKHVPSNSIILEVGPHDLLQTILKRSLDQDICHVGLMKRHHPNNITFFYNSLGRCYTEGVNLNPLGLFPPIDFPVPRGTPALSSLIEWDHSKSWRIPQSEDFIGGGHGQWSQSRFTFYAQPDGKDSQLTGHMIGGRGLFPVAGLVVMIWKAVARYLGKVYQDVPITIEDLKIHQHVAISDTDIVVFDVSFIPLLGDVEILENGILIASGKIVEDGRHILADIGADRQQVKMKLTQDEIYHELKMRGHNYSGQYQSITELNINGESGSIVWTGDWMTYLDGMIQVFLLANTTRSALLPVEVKSVSIIPELHRTIIQQHVGSVILDTDVKSVTSGGLCIRGLKAESRQADEKLESVPATIDTLHFVPLDEVVHSEHHSLDDHIWYGKVYTRLATECLSKLIQSSDKVGTSCIPYRAELEQHLAHEAEKILSDTDTVADARLHGPVGEYLQELQAVPFDENYLHNVRSLREDFDEFIAKDDVSGCLDSPRSLKPCIDIVTENVHGKTLRVLEVCQKENTPLLDWSTWHSMDTSGRTMECYISGDVHVDGCKQLDWNIDQKLAESVQPFHLIVLDNVLSQQTDVTNSLAHVVDSLHEDGFVLVKENTQQFLLVYALDGLVQAEVAKKGERSFGPWIDEDGWSKLFVGCGLNVVARKQDGVMSTLFLLRKVSKQLEQVCFKASDASKLDIDLIDADNLGSELLDKLTVRLTTDVEKSDRGESATVCISDDPTSGLTGLVDLCHNEATDRKIRFVHLEDKSDNFSKSDLKTSPEFLEQYEKDLVCNISRDGCWGQYHFLPITEDIQKTMDSTSVLVKGVGSLSCPTFVTKDTELSVTPLDDTDHVTCYPRYCVITNESVATVHGKQETDMLRRLHGLTIHKKVGAGFSGYDNNGQRVMGISTESCPATKMKTEKYLTWEIPDSWRMEDAYGVPSAYLMAYYTLFVSAGLKKDQSILISGLTDVSEAAVTIATQHCSQVFASTDLVNMMLYSGSKPDSDLKTALQVYTELDDVLRYTKGSGVDIVLNSCTDPTLTVSHLLKSGGHMINLDTQNKGLFTLDTDMIQKNCTVTSLTPDNLNEDDLRHVSELLGHGMNSGHVQPLRSRVYDQDKLYDAYCYKEDNMDSTVAIKFGGESHSGPVCMTALQILTCSPHKSYIIVNGMTRCGLDLADWLIEHEATKLLLTTTSSTHTGHMERRLQQWYTMGITVHVTCMDTLTDNTQTLVDEAKKSGPIGGIFYVPLIDVGEQTSLGSVCMATTSYAKYLDRVTRTSCNKTLDWFVVMPVHCPNDNFNLSAYSFVNTSLQRVVDCRTMDGFPGLYVSQAKPDFGNKPRMTKMVLNNLDTLLQQSSPVVRLTMKNDGLPDVQQKTEATVEELFETCKILLDIDNLSRSMEYRLVNDICADDAIIENIRDLIKNTLHLTFTCDTIKMMSVGELKSVCKPPGDVCDVGDVTREKCDADIHVVQYVRDYNTCITKLNTAVNNRHMSIYIVFDEDEFEEIVSLAGLIDCPVYGISKTSHDVPVESIQCQAGYLIQNLYVNNNCEPMILIGYKMSCAVAIEMALQLQEGDLNIVKHIICIEGSIQYVPLNDEQCFHGPTYQTLDTVDREQQAILSYMELYTDLTDEMLELYESLDPDIPVEVKVTSLVPWMITCHKSGRTNIQQSDMESRMLRYVHTYILSGQYENHNKYKGNMTLIRGRGQPRGHPKDIKTPSDYYLSQVCEVGVSVHILNTGHTDFLQDKLEDISHTVNALLHKVMSATT